MSELDRVIEAIHEWSARGVEFALATVVGVRGSTYRGLAARQLVGADGAGVGTVSGGCLDQALHQVAREVIATGSTQVVVFDLTADDEEVWGWGIGCNGVTEVLVEPAASAHDLADHLARIRVGGHPTAVIHSLTNGQVGSRSFVTASMVDGPVSAPAVAAARQALAGGRHAVVDGGGERLLIEVVGAPSRLLVCGAGHDAAPLVRLAAELGFEVTVVDDRRQFLTDDRFPAAAGLVHATPRELASVVELDSRTYAVIMSHNYLRDLGYLAVLIGTEVAYIGALGPGARLERLLKDLDAEGTPAGDADLAKLHGPAGLDLGAEGPTEIAWAILGEILAVRRARAGSFLTDRKGPAALRR